MTGAGAVFEDGVLVSTRFDDVYASRAGALAQARSVFLQGCGLPEMWAGRRHFTVGELGFGTGLNILALLDLWQKQRPEGGHLHVFSVERWLLEREQVARALQSAQSAPELQPLVQRLIARWPQQSRGRVRIDFSDLGATIDLALSEALPAVRDWQGMADAWFLDGFSPARNPDMWSAQLLQLLVARTRPGGRMASWSVAGHVRRALSDAGMQVERLPGFGGKRQRMEARKPGTYQETATPRIAIVGAGIAGASLSRSLRAMGAAHQIFTSGPMASDNPSALLAPRLASNSETATSLHAQAFTRAVDLLRQEAPQAIIATGADWLLKRDEPERARASLTSGLFPHDSLQLHPGRLHMRDALVISPRRLRQAWLAPVQELRLDALPQRQADGWWLGGEGPFDSLCLATGIGTADLTDLPLRAIRGQVTTIATDLRPKPETWGGYVVPTDDGLLFGATHDRGDADWSIRAADDQVNLDALALRKPELAAKLRGKPIRSYAGVRAGTGYNQPIATQFDDGLFVLTGLAGRGFTLAPLLAEYVVAKMLDVPSPVGREAGRLLGGMRMASLPGVPE